MKKRFPVVLLMAVLFCSCKQATNSNTASLADKDISEYPAKLKLVASGEPGESLVISGTVYLPDGKTPAKDAVIAVWQTDAKGFYIPGGGEEGEEHPRIHGRMKTGPDGKYELTTIKPAPYPNNSSPAHIHGHISAPGYPEYPIVYFFEGDSLITDKNRSKLNSNRGGTPSIIILTRDASGLLTGHRDFILEYVKPSKETMKLEW
jgi:protocatechuate 3,4-dioxygenase beta subunit